MPHFHQDFPKSQSAGLCVVVLSCVQLSDAMDCSPPDSSVHDISQARILECPLFFNCTKTDTSLSDCGPWCFMPVQISVRGQLLYTSPLSRTWYSYIDMWGTTLGNLPAKHKGRQAWGIQDVMWAHSIYSFFWPLHLQSKGLHIPAVYAAMWLRKLIDGESLMAPQGLLTSLGFHFSSVSWPELWLWLYGVRESSSLPPRSRLMQNTGKGAKFTCLNFIIIKSQCQSHMCALQNSYKQQYTWRNSCNKTQWTNRILQARILKWVAMPSSRGSYQPRDWTQVSCIAGGFFTIWATREAPYQQSCPD